MYVAFDRQRLSESNGRCPPRPSPTVRERGFALILDPGCMRQAWLCGRGEPAQRYLLHIAGTNLGFIMRRLVPGNLACSQPELLRVSPSPSPQPVDCSPC
ncbi:MAG: putative transposase [Belnapia sp.]|nr:putative transposase [Belnapia sp.]